MSEIPKFEPNVPMSDEEAAAAHASDEAWNGPRLIVLCAATLALALTALYFMSESTAEVAYPLWLAP